MTLLDIQKAQFEIELKLLRPSVIPNEIILLSVTCFAQKPYQTEERVVFSNMARAA